LGIKIKKRKPGFTLIEVLVALAITSIVISVSASMFFGTLLNMNTTTREQNRLVDFNTFKDKLIDDASKGSSIEIDNNCLKIITDFETIEYKFVTFESKTVVKRGTVNCLYKVDNYTLTSNSENSATIEIVRDKKVNVINIENDIKKFEFDSR
jgi:prepilin-type N-terminal cleavage/methylation domain-containing protein